MRYVRIEVSHTGPVPRSGVRIRRGGDSAWPQWIAAVDRARLADQELIVGTAMGGAALSGVPPPGAIAGHGYVELVG